jgi:tetratricopeptide (TPR) repeat protein
MRPVPVVRLNALRFSVVCLVAVCLDAHALLALDAESRLPSLREFAEQYGNFSYGLYQRDEKVGWERHSLRLGEHDGQPAAIYDGTAYLAIRRDGVVSTFRIRQVCVYSLESPGPLLYCQEWDDQDGNVSKRTGVPKNGRFAITIEADGQVFRTETPLPKHTLAEFRGHQLFARTAKSCGDSQEFFEISLQGDDVDDHLKCTYRGRRKAEFQGEEIEVARVEIERDGDLSVVDVLDNGRWLQGHQGSLEYRLEENADADEPRSVAFEYPLDIPLDKPLGDPELVTSLTLQIDGLGDFRLPTSHRQIVRSRDEEPGQVVLEVLYDGEHADRVPLLPEERAAYLADTLRILGSQEPFQQLAATIRGEAEDPQQIARRIKSWVKGNLRYCLQSNAPDAWHVLRTRRGDCSEHALLYVTLCRAAGIPAREVSGLVYTSEGTLGGHAWAEIHDGQRWITVDPTWDQFYVDGAHVALTYGQDSIPDWIYRRLTVKVLDFEANEIQSPEYWFDRQDHDRVIAMCSELIENDPWDCGAYFLRARARERTGQFEQTSADYDACLRVGPEYAIAYFCRAHLRYRRGDCDLALADYQAYVDRSPRDLPARRVLAECQRALGDLKGALANYKILLKTAPDNDAFRAGYAWVLIDLKCYSAARRTAAKAIQINDRCVEAYAALGHLWMLQGRRERAVKALRQAIELDDRRSMADLAWLLATAPDAGVRDGELALRYAARAVNLDPTDWRSLDAQAAALAELGRFESAVEMQQRAIKLAPQEQLGALRQRHQAYTAQEPYRTKLDNLLYGRLGSE